jgi:hypothetical protein
MLAALGVREHFDNYFLHAWHRISAACASVGALESGFTVEPCATIKSALSPDFTEETFSSLP